MRTLVIILTVFFWHGVLSAQNTSLTEPKVQNTDLVNYQIGLFLGISSYEGDVLCFKEEDINVFTEANVSFGLSFYKNFSHVFNAGITYINTKLAGSDAAFTSGKGHRDRGFSFTNTINEFALRLNYEPFGNKNWVLSPYVFGGAGMVFGRVDTDYRRSIQPQSRIVDIDTDIKDKKSSSFAIPIGAGLSWTISKKVNLNFEAGLRFGLNDYMDGVSKSGNSTINDYYGMGGVSLQYFFGKRSFSTAMKEI
jgi:opacity protein-like surface antigen